MVKINNVNGAVRVSIEDWGGTLNTGISNFRTVKKIKTKNITPASEIETDSLRIQDIIQTALTFKPDD